MTVLAMRKRDAARADEAVKLTEAAINAFVSAGDLSAVRYYGARLKAAQSVAHDLHVPEASLNEMKNSKRK
ncbi:hypothetical protein [Bradyrhizobium sp. WSM2254]|uniref:hypothetical protein n=1 Tax=Bradyrhizobium sp. WSM2254 TaxID=1188263 RepID=UPI00040BF429|nr:hypothetical protein [Bradyrhizobium sp. WSM2254]